MISTFQQAKEKINEKGNPTSISVYPQGGNVKSTYEYNYDCN